MKKEGKKIPNGQTSQFPFLIHTLHECHQKIILTSHQSSPKTCSHLYLSLIVSVPASISETASHMFAYFNNLSLVDPVGALATIGFYVSKIDLSGVYGTPRCSSCSSVIHKDFWVIKT